MHERILEVLNNSDYVVHVDLENLAAPLDFGLYGIPCYVLTDNLYNSYGNRLRYYEDDLHRIYPNVYIIENTVNKRPRPDLCDDKIIKFCKDYYYVINNKYNLLVTRDRELKSRFCNIFQDKTILLDNNMIYRSRYIIYLPYQNKSIKQVNKEIKENRNGVINMGINNYIPPQPTSTTQQGIEISPKVQDKVFLGYIATAVCNNKTTVFDCENYIPSKEKDLPPRLTRECDLNVSESTIIQELCNKFKETIIKDMNIKVLFNNLYEISIHGLSGVFYVKDDIVKQVLLNDEENKNEYFLELVKYRYNLAENKDEIEIPSVIEKQTTDYFKYTNTGETITTTSTKFIVNDLSKLRVSERQPNSNGLQLFLPLGDNKLFIKDGTDSYNSSTAYVIIPNKQMFDLMNLITS